MGNFRIYQDNYADFTVVSNRFIDEYMEDANDAQLKIYLYLLRMLGANLPTGVSDIADRFNYTEKDIMRAFKFWEKKGLLKLDYDADRTLMGVRILSLRDNDAITENTPAMDAAPESEAGLKTAAADTVTDIRSYSKPQGPSSQLIFVAEQYLRRTLSKADLDTLLFISDTLRFSDDLTDYLLQYCIGRGKTNHKYIETIAIDWAESGIKTSEEAAAYVAGMSGGESTRRRSAASRNKFNQFTQNTYDYDALEKALISN